MTPYQEVLQQLMDLEGEVHTLRKANAKLLFELKAKTAELEIADEQIERQGRAPLTGRQGRE
jgi:hypothetical protein